MSFLGLRSWLNKELVPLSPVRVYTRILDGASAAGRRSAWRRTIEHFWQCSPASARRCVLTTNPRCKHTDPAVASARHERRSMQTGNDCAVDCSPFCCWRAELLCPVALIVLGRVKFAQLCCPNRTRRRANLEFLLSNEFLPECSARCRSGAQGHCCG